MFSFKMLLSGLLAHAHAFARETLIIDSTIINASSSTSSPSLVVELPCVSGPSYSPPRPSTMNIISGQGVLGRP